MGRFVETMCQWAGVTSQAQIDIAVGVAIGLLSVLMVLIPTVAILLLVHSHQSFKRSTRD